MALRESHVACAVERREFIRKIEELTLQLADARALAEMLAAQNVTLEAEKRELSTDMVLIRQEIAAARESVAQATEMMRKAQGK